MQVFISQMKKKIIAVKDSTKHSSSQIKKTKIIKIKIKASLIFLKELILKIYMTSISMTIRDLIPNTQYIKYKEWIIIISHLLKIIMANFRAYRKLKAKIKKIIDDIYIFKEIELIN